RFVPVEREVDQPRARVELVLVDGTRMRARGEELIDCGLVPFAPDGDGRCEPLPDPVLMPEELDASLQALVSEPAKPLVSEGDAVVDHSDDDWRLHGCAGHGRSPGFPGSPSGSDSLSRGNPSDSPANTSRSNGLSLTKSKKSLVVIAAQKLTSALSSRKLVENGEMRSEACHWTR